MPYMLRSGRVGYAAFRLAAAALMLVATAHASAFASFDIKKVEASVYKIFATPKGSTGTGFLVSGRRTVVTNFHVIEKNTEFMVLYRDGKEVKEASARVIAYKPERDLAVLRVDRDLPGTALVLGDFEPDKLTEIVTVGFPAAADDAVKGRPLTVPELLKRVKDPAAMDPTVTTGTVSRMTSAESPQLQARTVQHNAAINPGNSGGPLFDKCANVIGVNTLVALNSQGLFFSVHASEIVKLLREYGIEYAAVQRPCVAAQSSGGGGGTMLSLVLGMSAALALAALVFALRGGASLGGIGDYVSRLTQPGARSPRTPPQQPPHKPFSREPVPISGGQNWAAATGASMSLQAVKGGRSFPLDAGRAVTVGRGQQAQIMIEDDTVSSSHARLQFDPASRRVTVTDLKSSNGTYLNGSRVTSTQAQVGDVLRFGTAEFRLAMGNMPAPMPVPMSVPPNRGWMLSGFDPAGRAVQFELRPMVENGSAGGEATTTWTFGRDKSRSQFVIDDKSVSGAHAEITYVPQQGLTLRDLGSTNGTRVDGEPLGERTVALDETGQEITFGAAKLRLSRLIG